MLYLLVMLTIRGPLLDVIEASREAVTLARTGTGLPSRLAGGAGLQPRLLHTQPRGRGDRNSGRTDPAILREYRRDWFDTPTRSTARFADTGVRGLFRRAACPNGTTMQRHPALRGVGAEQERPVSSASSPERSPLPGGGRDQCLSLPVKGEPDFGHRESSGALARAPRPGNSRARDASRSRR